MDNETEILRLRDKIHALSGTVHSFNWRIRGIEKWQEEISAQVLDIHETLEEIIKADEIADAVSEKIKLDRTFKLTRVQKLVVSGASLAAIADFTLRVIGKA